MSRACFFVCILLSRGLSVANALEPSILEPKWMFDQSTKVGFVRVAPRAEKAVVGSTVELDVTFTSNLFATFLNPFWESTAALPGNVFVFDDQRHFLGYLANSSTHVSAHKPEITLRGSSTAGTMLRIRAGTETIVETQDDLKLIQMLGPGKYLVQAIYTDRFLRSEADGSVIAASELATFEILSSAESIEESQAVSENSNLGRAEVVLPKKEFRIGERFHYEIRYTNTTGRPISVYNAFGWNSLRPRGSGLFLSLDSDVPLEDVFHLDATSRMSAHDIHFITLPPNAIAGNQFIFLSPLGTLKPRSRGDRLPAGEYYLRAAYTDFFFAENPFEEDSELSPQAWYEKYHDRPVLVSEPVKFKYVGLLR